MSTTGTTQATPGAQSRRARGYVMVGSGAVMFASIGA